MEALEKRFFSIPLLPALECVASMAESTILACVEPNGNASVMAWALMDTEVDGTTGAPAPPDDRALVSRGCWSRNPKIQ